MKIVVDSNIVFSAILNTKSKIGHSNNGLRHKVLKVGRILQTI